MPREHDGYDWLYVLSGRLRLVLGDDEFVLGPGEAAEFDTRTPHWIGVVDEPVDLIGLFGPSGERVHLRG
jgi:quercetin dioxygenase-like cupin family protein